MTYDFPQNIDLTYPAVQYRLNDPSSAQITAVEIKGKILRPLFRRKEFTGKIRIDGYEFTKTYGQFDIIFYQNRGFLFYHDRSEIRTLGTIWIDGDFNRLNLYIFEERDQPSDLRISAPARTYDEAMKIDELSRQVGE